MLVLQATNCGENTWLQGWVLQAGACNMKILALWNEGKIRPRNEPMRSRQGWPGNEAISSCTPASYINQQKLQMTC